MATFLLEGPPAQSGNYSANRMECESLDIVSISNCHTCRRLEETEDQVRSTTRIKEGIPRYIVSKLRLNKDPLEGKGLGN